MNRFLVAVALASVASVHPQVAAAQDPSELSLDLDGTLGRSAGGTYADSGFLGLDLLVALRLREISSGAWLAALGIWIMPTIGYGDVCRILPNHSGCLPQFPSLTTWSALVGWESGRPGSASLRLLVGPALYSGGGSTKTGAMVRVDIATPTLFHFALTASGRGSLMPALPGGATSLWAAGIGVRIR
jgi:hypothetical protein